MACVVVVLIYFMVLLIAMTSEQSLRRVGVIALKSDNARATMPKCSYY
jgi:hypothetical protein